MGNSAEHATRDSFERRCAGIVVAAAVVPQCISGMVKRLLPFFLDMAACVCVINAFIARV